MSPTRSSPARSPRVPARVAFVGGGPGDPGLLTVRATELLAAADAVVLDQVAREGLALRHARADVDVVDAWDYLTQPKYSDLRNVRIVNLCRSYKYQTTGFYVSLLAEARGHKPLPSIQTLQDLRSQSIIRVVSDDLDEEIEKSLGPLVSDEFTLSIYFGRNVAKLRRRLVAGPVPLLRAVGIPRLEQRAAECVRRVGGRTEGARLQLAGVDLFVLFRGLGAVAGEHRHSPLSA